MHPLIARLLHMVTGKHWDEWHARPVQEVLDKFTKNKELQAILCGQFGNYGMPPSEASFFIHSGVVAHYLDGGFYPVGGPGRIAEALIPTIEKAGGRVFVKAMVEQIVVEEGRATGVLLVGGDKVMAKEGVISTAGARNTFNKLLPEGLPGIAEARALVEPVGNSMSHVCAFVGLEGSAEEMELESSNLWVLPTHTVSDDYDLDTMIKRYHADPIESEELMFFMGFPSVKDPSYKERYPDKSVACIIAEAQASWFEDWKDEKCMKRSDAYKAKKKEFEEKLLRGMHKYYPKTAGKVKFVDMSSPLTNIHYLASPGGASYGLDGTPARWGCDALKPATPVPGLFLSGQDVASSGFAGALMGAVLCCHAILGYGAADLVLFDRNLINDLKNLQ